MSILFSGSELLEIALGIERNGAAFYQALADKTQNKNAKAIYEHLASEERKHLNTFQGMLNTLGQYQPPEAYAEEYMLYLKSLVDSSVFSNVTEAQQKAERYPVKSKPLILEFKLKRILSFSTQKCRTL